MISAERREGSVGFGALRRMVLMRSFRTFSEAWKLEGVIRT